MGFSRQEYWSGLPCPSPGIEPRPPALQADTLPSEPPGTRRSELHKYVPDKHLKSDPGVGGGAQLSGLAHPSECWSPWGRPHGEPLSLGGRGCPITARVRPGRGGLGEPAASVNASPSHPGAAGARFIWQTPRAPIRQQAQAHCRREGARSEAARSPLLPLRPRSLPTLPGVDTVPLPSRWSSPPRSGRWGHSRAPYVSG